MEAPGMSGTPVQIQTKTLLQTTRIEDGTCLLSTLLIMYASVIAWSAAQKPIMWAHSTSDAQNHRRVLQNARIRVSPIPIRGEELIVRVRAFKSSSACEIAALVIRRSGPALIWTRESKCNRVAMVVKYVCTRATCPYAQFVGVIKL